MMDNRQPLVTVRDLSVTSPDGVKLVEDVSLHVDAGDSLGIVGESGSGKSLTALAITGLLAELEISGRRFFKGQDLAALSASRMRTLRGQSISYVFQDPGTSMLPVRSVGAQIIEQIRIHKKVTRAEACHQMLSLLGDMGLPDPASLQHKFIYQLSGGMRQRVMIAMAISCAPDLLIADEPTSALDVTVQSQILAIFQRLQRSGMALILVSHDLGVVADTCKNLSVFYGGMIVEYGPTQTILTHPLHPYTAALRDAIPAMNARVGTDRPRLSVIPGVLPQPSERPGGCVFAPRCTKVTAGCQTRPPLIEQSGRLVRCINT